MVTFIDLNTTNEDKKTVNAVKTAFEYVFRYIIFIFITLASLTIMISCSSEEEIVVPKEENEQTVIMFFPWSSNLLPYFQQNIKDFSKSIEERGSQNARVMVCLATTPNTADLMELKYDNGSCIVENIRTYDNQRFTSQDGISNILKAIKEYALERNMD